MKNHLSTLPSIGAGAKLSPLGMFRNWLWSTRSGDFAFVTFVLSPTVNLRPLLVQWVRVVQDLQTEIARGRLSSNQSLPCVAALPYHLESILSVLALAAERKLVFWLSVWDFVDSEPLICSPQQAW